MACWPSGCGRRMARANVRIGAPHSEAAFPHVIERGIPRRETYQPWDYYCCSLVPFLATVVLAVHMRCRNHVLSFVNCAHKSLRVRQPASRCEVAVSKREEWTGRRYRDHVQANRNWSTLFLPPRRSRASEPFCERQRNICSGGTNRCSVRCIAESVLAGPQMQTPVWTSVAMSGQLLNSGAYTSRSARSPKSSLLRCAASSSEQVRLVQLSRWGGDGLQS
jgi:hypothetical protein